MAEWAGEPGREPTFEVGVEGEEECAVVLLVLLVVAVVVVVFEPLLGRPEVWRRSCLREGTEVREEDDPGGG